MPHLRVPNSIANFFVLKYRGRTPTLAACLLCDLKFLTPTELMEDWQEATSYLKGKFDVHRCAKQDGTEAEEDKFLSMLFPGDCSRKLLRKRLPDQKNRFRRTA